jgi:hypothetical protein
MARDELLAFDPVRVGLLFRSLCRALDQLRAVPIEACTPDVAGQATLSVRRAIADIDTVWIPLVQRVLRADVSSPSRVVDDPVALAAVTSDLRDIAHDPIRSRLALRTYASWPELAAQLAGERQMLALSPEAEHITVGEVDAALGSLGAVVGASLSAACSSTDALAALTDVSPYTAVAMLSSIRLDSFTLADTVAALVQRWLDEPHLLQVVGTHDDADPIDGLLALLVDDPIACTRFVADVSTRPEVLLVPGHDASLAQRVVLIGTDPAHIASSASGALVLPVIHAVTSSSEVDPAEWGNFLVDLVAPWTVQFSPHNDDWHVDASRRTALLAEVLGADGSADRLLHAGDRVLANLDDWIRREHPSMEDLAAYIGSLGLLISEDRMKDVQAKKSARDLLFGVISLAVSALPLTVGVGLAATAIVWVAHSMATPDVRAERGMVNRGEDTALAVTGASVALRITQAWQKTGKLSPDFPLPPKADPNADYPSLRFVNAFGKWRDTLPGGYYGALADRITREVYTVVNPAQTGEHLVILMHDTMRP